VTEKTAVCFRLVDSLALSKPFWQYAAMFGPDENAFLLDSAMDPDRLGKFSFLGGNPSAILRAWRLKDQSATKNGPPMPFSLELKSRISPSGQVMSDNWPGVSPQTSVGDPFFALRDLHRSFFPEEISNPLSELSESSAGPFNSGLVGGFGYGLAHAIENLTDTGIDDLNLPDMVFMVVDEVMAFNHHTGQAFLTIVGRGCNQTEAHEQATINRSHFLDRLRDFESTKKPDIISPQTIDTLAQSLTPRDFSADSPTQAFSLPLQAHFGRTTYASAVQKCRNHIFCGDVFEICLTHRLEAEQSGTPWDIYQVLRHINPAPFSAWLQFADFQIASASPERFLNLNEKGVAESRPIKGTRPRGKSPAEDAILAKELASSEKDQAENVMIVDLVRNDLGKVCRTGSVIVPEMLVVEKYSSVFQLVSTVQGMLGEDKDAFDLVRACFPGGSMTGAPKIEAMQIIDSLEPVNRGLYSGAIGYIDASGVMDLSIVIRTLVCKDGRVTMGVGGAVVADSDPIREYNETLDKAQALVDALIIAQSL